jgi:hypothetical protein
MGEKKSIAAHQRERFPQFEISKTILHFHVTATPAAPATLSSECASY